MPAQKQPTKRDLDIYCPSARCEEGSLLMGIVQSDGSVAIAVEPIVVDEAFVAIARQGRQPESRFRFASKCLEKGCGNWSGRCTIADDFVNYTNEIKELPDCSLRKQCRWFTQIGSSACHECSKLITDIPLQLDSSYSGFNN